MTPPSSMPCISWTGGNGRVEPKKNPLRERHGTPSPSRVFQHRIEASLVALLKIRDMNYAPIETQKKQLSGDLNMTRCLSEIFFSKKMFIKFDVFFGKQSVLGGIWNLENQIWVVFLQSINQSF